MDLQFTLENKIRELESINRTLLNEKQKFEIDYKVVSERFNELKITYDSLENNFNLLKNKQVDVNWKR
jgi:predicted nuclease with TOPRIM domain